MSGFERKRPRSPSPKQIKMKPSPKQIKMEPSPKTIYYIYGRFNPPHSGHMHLITETLKEAKKNNGMVLILLGNGERNTYAENPLGIKLKQEIIREHIPGEYKDYKFIEVPGGTVLHTIRKYLLDLDNSLNYETKQKTKNGNESITIPDFEERYKVIHATGDKESKNSNQNTSDKKKLNFISTALFENNVIIGEQLTIEPQQTQSITKPMSATIVRADALTLPYTEKEKEKGEEKNENEEEEEKNENEEETNTFEYKYKYFYGENTRAVYDAIHKGNNLQENPKDTIIQNEYDNKALLPKPKKGGTKKQRCRKTKRRKLSHRNISRRR